MPVHGIRALRYTLHAWWRVEGRTYALLPVEYHSHDEAMRAYRRAANDPGRHGIPVEGTEMAVVGPLVSDELVGRAWRYHGTPGPPVVAVEDGVETGVLR